MIVTDERVARFVSERLGVSLCPPYTCLGTEIDGEIVNGVIVNGWQGTACDVTVAGSKWGAEIVRATGEYVFGQLGCLRMTVTTEKPEVVSIARRMGGEVEGVMRDWFGKGRDAIVIGLLRADWKYGRFLPS